MIQHYVFLLSSFVHQIIMEKSKKVASLSFCIPRPFPLNDGGDHILAVATVAPRDLLHLKPRPLLDDTRAISLLVDIYDTQGLR